jgi:hypothetical protein
MHIHRKVNEGVTAGCASLGVQYGMQCKYCQSCVCKKAWPACTNRRGERVRTGVATVALCGKALSIHVWKRKKKQCARITHSIASCAARQSRTGFTPSCLAKHVDPLPVVHAGTATSSRLAPTVEVSSSHTARRHEGCSAKIKG